MDANRLDGEHGDGDDWYVGLEGPSEGRERGATSESTPREKCGVRDGGDGGRWREGTRRLDQGGDDLSTHRRKAERRRARKGVSQCARGFESSRREARRAKSTHGEVSTQTCSAWATGAHSQCTRSSPHQSSRCEEDRLTQARAQGLVSEQEKGGAEGDDRVVLRAGVRGKVGRQAGVAASDAVRRVVTLRGLVGSPASRQACLLL